ncbi:uncharacterized protein LOC132719481 [Ruditapes philippinarum]|uniref:uncharacterized protein LOC132719481 n=1 Tax=Ruditapes philippinarum TaxID=129788 RepID=UPI00295AC2A7|nr:uncharacterized protein LOC132719481 [Ruditapes philippinarum]
MFQEPEYRENLSLALSEILDDIGVNERLVMTRRKHRMMNETMWNITDRLTDTNITKYHLGGQSESTTTRGLDSGIDVLYCMDDCNIIQDWSEWEHGKRNYLMIQDENTSPGYCLLQLLRHDEPLPATVIPNEQHITDRSGRILLKNTIFDRAILGAVRHGPANAIPGQHGISDIDHVPVFHCKSWLQSASGWLDRQGIRRWPTQDMRRYAASTGCIVVPVGSKVSRYPELEWRISTSLAERCLILSLNITQTRCYVLLKIILKSFLNPQGEINISSFMCKTVLLHCVENTELSIWNAENLSTCLTYCLLELHTCVQNDSCSHFIIQENNLMAGRFTAEEKHELLERISYLLQNVRQMLFSIDIDDLGHRLQVKLYRVPHGVYYFQSSIETNEFCLLREYFNTAYTISRSHKEVLDHLHDKSIRTMMQSVGKLMTFSDHGNRLEQATCKFLEPLLCTTYGSVLASSSIAENNQVSHEALVWLSAGLNSDISSSRLKLASVFYSTEDIDRAELILRHTEQQYYSYHVVPICACWHWTSPAAVSAELMRASSEQGQDLIKHITAFCVRFIQKESNCVPRELQYEMLRSTQNDIPHRNQCRDYMKDWTVIDSLPFLYFLQYKVYRHLQRIQDQRQALCKLIRTIVTDKDLGHRETALNILGQCMEQENKPHYAFKCYLRSLKGRPRNNVASIHICKLISSILVRQLNESYM